jgi:hypothetical protein
MALAVRAFFMALQKFFNKQPALRKELQIHFIGTSYAPKGRATKTVEPLAIEAGLADIVNEQTDRLPFFESLQCLLDAEALFIPGSDDPGYTASKIYPYILARKPLLAVFHEASSVVDVLRRTRAGTVVTFNGSEDPVALSEAIYREWFERWPIPAPQADWQAFETHAASEMTRRLCGIFNEAATG